ncbi:MAG: hypothetical protein EPO22_12175 [Dehalococcoidia bacterium]|nr:MAG: hypothetical protein EPO22_12175 [Dehalococcoidia bacterium]
MPPLGLHMTVARDLARELKQPAIEAERGAYYLGATTPDIRIITRWDRARTHFFDLNEFEEQNGVHRLFEQEPALLDVTSLNPATAAFVAGYISHLVMDERYICEIYRPVFGERSELGGDVKANIMDRVLQFELDRRDREDREKVDEIKTALAESAVEVSVGFIARDKLLEWRDVSIQFLSHPPTWDRFHRLAGRYLAAAGIEGDERMQQFMDDVPALLDTTIECVGADRIRDYLSGAGAEARRRMKEYLS